MQAEAYDRSYRFGQVVEAVGGPPLRLSVSMDQEISGSSTSQLIVLCLVTILPRITERYTLIDLCLPRQKVSIPRVTGPEDFATYILKEISAICPWGQFRCLNELEGPYDHSIVVGWKAPERSRHVVHVLASGWRTFVSEAGAPPSLALTFNPFSCLAAAALAAMFVYRRAEKLHACEIVLESKINGWSLLDYTISAEDGPPLPPEIYVDEVAQAGLGGTGNALLWGLRFGPELIGRWRGFEHELADISNWNRYLLMKPSDALSEKTKIIMREFAGIHRRLRFSAEPAGVEKFYSTIPSTATVLATVDDPGVRVALQRHSGEVLLNVGTNSQWFGISRHELAQVTRGKACIECLYGDPKRMERRQRESTVSFVLALIGAVLGAEFTKRYALPSYGLDNAWFANVFYPEAAHIECKSWDTRCATCALIAQRPGLVNSKHNVMHPFNTTLENQHWLNVTEL